MRPRLRVDVTDQTGRRVLFVLAEADIALEALAKTIDRWDHAMMGAPAVKVESE